MSALASRIALAVLAANAALLGVWAALAPRSFFDDFPGFGRVWVAGDGPYNEHLVRDFGGLNLALAVVTLAALLTLARPIVVTAATAWLAWSVPHFVYHLRHRDVFGGADQAGALGGVVLLGALAVVLLAFEVRRVEHVGSRASVP